MAPCIVCENQVARHFFAGHGTMLVQLCKEHQSFYEHLGIVEVIPSNPTCPVCPQFGKCCKTKAPEGTL